MVLDMQNATNPSLLNDLCALYGSINPYPTRLNWVGFVWVRWTGPYYRRSGYAGQIRIIGSDQILHYYFTHIAAA